MFESRRPDPRTEDHAATALCLVIDNRPTAVWSLATWLAIDFAGLECALVEVDMFAPDRRSRLAELTPNGKVPVLLVDETPIWESPAIMEWAAEYAPSLWPADGRYRAVARSVVAELLTGFPEISDQLPADWFARYRLRRQLPARAQVEVYRLTQLLIERLDAADASAFLFGDQPVLADFAMVPMAGRLRTYGLLPKEGRAREYAERLLELEPLARWFAGSEPVPALATPPAIVAAPRQPAAGAAKAGNADDSRSGVFGAEPSVVDGGGRRLEDIVARARQRERVPEPSTPTTAEHPVVVVEPPTVAEAHGVAGPPARDEPPAEAASRPSPPPLLLRRPSARTADVPKAVATSPAPEPAPQAPRRGLPWLGRRLGAAGSSTPVGGGRRRPPTRD